MHLEAQLSIWRVTEAESKRVVSARPLVATRQKIAFVLCQIDMSMCRLLKPFPLDIPFLTDDDFQETWPIADLRSSFRFEDVVIIVCNDHQFGFL
jgi:hypothetical protein